MPRGIYPRTAEGRANIAAARRAAPPLSAETRAKIRMSARANAQDPAWRQKVSDGTRQRMHDPEIRERHLTALKNVFQQTPNGNNFPVGTPASQLDFAAVLCPAGYLMDTVRLAQGRSVYVLDFAHPEAKVNIEIDGSSHRGHEVRDARRDVFLRSLGWKVIRIRVY